MHICLPPLSMQGKFYQNKEYYVQTRILGSNLRQKMGCGTTTQAFIFAANMHIEISIIYIPANFQDIKNTIIYSHRADF